MVECEDSLTGAYLRHERSIPMPEERREPEQRFDPAHRRRGAQPARHRRRDPARHAHARDRRVRIGQVLARERHARACAGEQVSTGRDVAPASTRAIEGLDAIDKVIDIDQTPIGRTPRSNPATYTGVWDDVRQLFASTPDAKARGYSPGSLLVQREGRSLRGVQGRRPDQDRDALPARRLRTVRGLRRCTLQPRDAPGHLPRQDRLRHPRHDRRGGTALLREHPQDQAQAPDALRRGARLHPHGTAGDDAVRRRGAARQARQRAPEAVHGAHALHPRRADDRPPLRRRAPAPDRACSGSSTGATPSS